MEVIQTNHKNPNILKKTPQELLKNDQVTAIHKTKNESDTTSKKDHSIDEYLTLISRLENRIKNGEIKDEELNKILTALEKKIESLSDKSRIRLFQLDEFKKMKIEDQKLLKKALIERIKDTRERDKVFNFLKSKEFIATLKGQPDKPLTYNKPV